MVWTSFMVFNFQYCGHFYYRTLSVFVFCFCCRHRYCFCHFAAPFRFMLCLNFYRHSYTFLTRIKEEQTTTQSLLIIVIVVFFAEEFAVYYTACRNFAHFARFAFFVSPLSFYYHKHTYIHTTVALDVNMSLFSFSLKYFSFQLFV